MKKSIFYTFTFTMVSLFLLSSCEKEDPIIPNEEELITTLTYTLVDLNGNEAIFRFQDLDGDGPMQATLESPKLQANTNYLGSLSLLNETTNPAESITEEIQAEAEDHQFFFQFMDVNASIVYSDSDSNGDPIGLQTQFQTQEAGQGTLTIILRHEPNKSGTGVSDGNIVQAGGETDIEIEFDVEVE